MSNDHGIDSLLHYEEQIAKAEQAIKDSNRGLTVLYLLFIVQVLLIIVQTATLFTK